MSSRATSTATTRAIEPPVHPLPIHRSPRLARRLQPIGVAIVNRPGFTAAKKGERILCEVIDAHLLRQAGHPATITLTFEADYQLQVTFDGAELKLTYPKFEGYHHHVIGNDLPRHGHPGWWSEHDKAVATAQVKRRGIDVFHVYSENGNEHYNDHYHLRFLCPN